MIDKDKILNNVKLMQGIEDESQDDVLKVLIDVSISKLLELRYPFDLDKTEVDLEKRFEGWIARACSSMYENQGQYNISQFSQNGVQITYSNLSDGIDQSLINAIMPYAGVPK